MGSGCGAMCDLGPWKELQLYCVVKNTGLTVTTRVQMDEL
jgi:hypothetical protein